MSASISKVKKEFGAWRREHGGKTRGLPLELQAHAVQLLDEYTWSAIREQLSISNSSLSKWRHSQEVQQLVKRVDQAGDCGTKGKIGAVNSWKASEFVEIAAMEGGLGLMQKELGQLRVKLETPQGFGLHIEGPMDGGMVQGLAQVVCQLGGR